MKYALPLLIAGAGLVFAAPSEDPQEIIKHARSAYEQLKTCQIVANSTNVMTTELTENRASGEPSAIRDRLSQGLRRSAAS
jgi:hypothetical protein